VVDSVTIWGGEFEQIQFLLGHVSVQIGGRKDVLASNQLFDLTDIDTRLSVDFRLDLKRDQE